MEFHIRLPAQAVADLEAATGLISHLRSVAPTGGEGFDREFLAPISFFAGWVQDLPASPDHHSDPGGLLRHAVQSGYFALRLADGVVFGGQLPAETRRVVDRESRRAAFLAALASPIALPHRYLTVASPDGEAWSEFSAPSALREWAGERGGRYILSWRRAPSEPIRAVGVWMAGNILATHWGEMSREVVLSAMSAVAPEDTPLGQETPLQKIVRQALVKSAEAMRKMAAARYVAPENLVIPDAQSLDAHLPTPVSSMPKAAEAAPEPLPHTEPERHRSSQTELQLPGGAATNPLAALSPMLRELIEAMAEDIRQKESVRRRVNWDETGQWLLVDQNLLGGYTMPAQEVAAALKKAKLAKDGNGRSLRIVESVGRILLPKEP